MNRVRGDYDTMDRQGHGLLRVWQSRPGRAAGTAAGNPNVAGEERAQHDRALEEQLTALRRERDELRQALFQAAQVQRKLCAPRELRRGRFEMAGEIFPVHYISGDFYDVQELGEAIGLAVGDIAGKGLAAGLWFAHLVGLIRIHACSDFIGAGPDSFVPSPEASGRDAGGAGSLPDPAAAVAAINRDLHRLPSGPPMASLFLGRLDLQRGELVYCNAGQPPALLLRRDGAVESLREGGPLLGAVPQASFRSGRVLIEPGDTLMGYSDGIVECRNRRGEEFGVRRLLAAARSAGRSSASRILFTVLGAVQDFAGSHPAGRDDDFTLMVVRRLDEGPACRR